MFPRLISILLAAVLFSSCEKSEDALVLPPAGTATHMAIEMGPEYDKQVFFDFETGAIVFTSNPASWDLAFEAGADGRHVFINGGKDVFVYNTGQTDMKRVTELPLSLKSSGVGWQFDAPSGLPDSTAIGEWFGLAGETKGEVYIIQSEKGVYQKMRILSADAQRFVLEWAALSSVGAVNTVVLAKDDAYNFVYFSFSTGLVLPEPPKNSWDVVFTRYRYVYHTPDYPNFPYEVNGVLLNPSGPAAAKDSSTSFDQLSLQLASSLPLSRNRDIIGFDWKIYNFSTTRYEVNRAKNFVLQSRNDQLFKFRFLEFYNSSGIKGYPTFEYERLR